MQSVSNPHALSAEIVVKNLSVSTDKGLTESEARERQTVFGKNELKEVKRKSLFNVFLVQFKSPIVYLLLGAVIISVFFKDNTEAIAIFVVIIVNAMMGFFMEAQAIRSMEALRRLDRVTAKVWRQGTLTEVASEEVVPGDILFVEAGDLVSADARLLTSVQLASDESPLTGESVPVAKIVDSLPDDTIVADRKNMVFKGTIVTRGNARAVVTATGMKTELGKISALVHAAEDEAIPLNEKLEKFSKRLILLTGFIVLPLLVIGLLEKRDTVVMIKTTIALAVAAIPEGLPIVATIALARGMLKLAKHQVIVKKLAAVETLGSTNVIFTDKTGTLTENRLEVTTLCLPNQTIEIEWDEANKSIRFNPPNISSHNQSNLQKLLTVAVMCNNASFSENQVTGDPLEIALLKIGEYHRTGFLEEVYSLFPRIYEYPFDSETKIMGTIHEYEGKNFAAVKGATEEVLRYSSFILSEGQVKTFSDEEKKTWLTQHDNLGKNGLRALAFAYKENVPDTEGFIGDLVFVGLAGFIDPPREEVRESIRECHDAGIRVVMVTGDHTETAKHIARRIGLTTKENETVIHGKNLAGVEQLSGNEETSLLHANIFTRVSPKQKLDLIKLYQEKGWIVGMTGDGVNDAPALKKADIGIAMGKRGTQVAREAADMVLQNDSFTSIVKAIKYGRVIYDNIRTFIIYLLSCNLSEILIVAFAGFFNLALPLQPIQILFLNIVTDVFPALALGMNEGKANVMKRKPRNPDEPMINRKNWISIFSYSFFITISVFSVFLYSHLVLEFPATISNNIAFFSLAFAQLIHPLNLASRRVSFFYNEITRNRYLWGAVAFCMLLIFLAYIIEPLNEVLSLEKLPPTAWVLVAIGSVLHLGIIQLAKRTNIIS